MLGVGWGGRGDHTLKFHYKTPRPACGQTVTPQKRDGHTTQRSALIFPTSSCLEDTSFLLNNWLPGHAPKPMLWVCQPQPLPPRKPLLLGLVTPVDTTLLSSLQRQKGKKNPPVSRMPGPTLPKLPVRGKAARDEISCPPTSVRSSPSVQTNSYFVP